MMTKRPRVSIVAAMSAENRSIGKNGKLLWHISDDLKQFKQLTNGHPVIMGRKTFDSIVDYLGKPLLGRTNIVITRSPEKITFPDVIACTSLEDALEQARKLDKEEIFIGGGSDIYMQALPYTDRLYLTLVDDTKDADTFFPPYKDKFTKEISREKRTHGKIYYTWIILER